MLSMKSRPWRRPERRESHAPLCPPPTLRSHLQPKPHGPKNTGSWQCLNQTFPDLSQQTVFSFQPLLYPTLTLPSGYLMNVFRFCCFCATATANVIGPSLPMNIISAIIILPD